MAHVRKIARIEALALLNAQGDGKSEVQFAALFSAVEVGRSGDTATGHLWFYVNQGDSPFLPGSYVGKPSELTGEDYANVYEVMLADAELNPLHPIKVADETPETITVGDEYFPAQFAGVPVE